MLKDIFRRVGKLQLPGYYNRYLLITFMVFSFLSCNRGSTPNPAPFVTKTTDTTVVVTGAKSVVKTNNQKVYVHYMPWFETPATSGTNQWGQHWTMANENPNVILANGRRQIASWFYPMIGPYDSDDRDVIDYHLLLMKYFQLMMLN